MLIHKHTCDTIDEATKYANDYIEEYPPQGYMTRLMGIEETSDGKWLVIMRRAKSCD